MVNHVIKERLDLYKFPKTNYPHKGDAITIGDLHGNALKLIHFLLRHNVIQFKDTVADPRKAFEEFAFFYEHSRNLVAPCFKALEEIDFNQHVARTKKKIIDNNTAAFEEMLTIVLPEGLQSKEVREGLLGGASNRYDFFQYLPSIEGIVKTVIGSYATEQDKAISENLRENFRTIIRTHLAETEDIKPFGEKLAEFLPEIEQTFPEIVKKFKKLIDERTALMRHHNTFVTNREAAEIKLNHELAKLGEIVPIFNEFMNNLEVTDRSMLVRLIGDELADRGSNDYFTLRVLDLLHENGVQVHTNISNHSNEFVSAYENLNFTSPGVVIGKQQPSFLALKLFVDNGLISKDEVDKLIERSYKPTLRAIDYALSDTGITLYTHAPVGFALIRLIADGLGVQYNDSTKEALATTIDQINRTFAVVVAENRVHKLCDTRRISNLKDMTEQQIQEQPLVYLIWNRWNESKDTEEARPEIVNGYRCSYVHGHDDFTSRFEHVINLDTSCGKDDLQTEKRRVADAEAVLKSEPDSPLGLQAKKYLESIEERVLVSGYAPTAAQNLKQEVGSPRDLDASADDDSQLRGP